MELTKSVTMETSLKTMDAPLSVRSMKVGLVEEGTSHTLTHVRKSVGMVTISNNTSAMMGTS